ncbi:hypothetical protein HMPREF1624_01026 [Sporothrix schenckii ATCC 58251]|uniref:Actin-like ATPase domain-containing protein n=1 Tax=Sporothrix schenckii (strain ATCC 58251 / de Perez 2211183) TaxID=1391915 RepID=U7Q6Q4_SPOS1|nr:hypothetical protein HMPREF1624_01026 [Sporothrix schenckii ATCC 58251]
MESTYSSSDRWNYFRDMTQRDEPQAQTQNLHDQMPPYGDAPDVGTGPPRHNLPHDEQIPEDEAAPRSIGNNNTGSINISGSTTRTESPVSSPPATTSGQPIANPSPFNFNLQYSFPGHPNRRSLRSWIHELPDDARIAVSANINSGSGSGSGTSSSSGRGHGSAVGGSINIAPATGLDPARRPSVTSTMADTESLMSPSSSRASPRPMGPNIPVEMRYRFPSLAGLDPISLPPTPGPVPSHLHYQPSLSTPPTTTTAVSNVTVPSHSLPTVPTMSTLGAGLANMSLGGGSAVEGNGAPHIPHIPHIPHTPHIPPAHPPYHPRPAPPPPPPMPTYVPVELPRPISNVGGPGGAAKIEPLPPSAARFVAIGIDFGTTYSGVSWAFSGDPTDIKDVQQYPCVGTAYNSRDEVQVPTQYDQRSGAWGYLVAQGHSPIKWFKLLLLRDADIRDDIRNSPYLQAARQQASLLGEDGVVDLIADYLRNLWQHCLREIELQIDAQALQDLPFKVAITIPAIWPQYARNMMKNAARRAGILQPRDIDDTTLILVEEPEAAALATLLDRRAYPEMAVGETFMVVDCGGGTIDIISYKVMQKTPFVIHEAVKGDGKLCGAFMVDDKFENHMKHMSGLKFDNCDPADFRKFVYEEWEYAIKRSFTGSETQQEFYLHPPIKAFSAFSRFKGNNKFVLKRSTIVDFFDDTYQGIRQLINDQNKKIVAQEGKPPKKIILVGGLGSSRYLLRKLQTEYSNVMQPQRTWSAVARGAVIKLLKNTFSQSDVVPVTDERQRQLLLALPEMDVRIARYSYGVETGVPLQHALPPVEPGVDRISTEPDGQQRVWRMQWYLKQGEFMDNREPVSHKFYEYVTSAASKQTKFMIYTSGQMPPPCRREDGCSLLCTIFCDYDTPYHELPVVDDTRGLRIVDDMHLTMRFNGEPEWRLQVGKKSTEQKVNVRFE